jgi:hypothetical protein
MRTDGKTLLVVESVPFVEPRPQKILGTGARQPSSHGNFSLIPLVDDVSFDSLHSLFSSHNNGQLRRLATTTSNGCIYLRAARLLLLYLEAAAIVHIDQAEGFYES